MQTVSEETDAALKNYKTFDKNGPTLDGIKTWRENVKRTRESLAQAAEMRKQKAAQHVIDETFPDDGTEETELNRSLMNEILSGGTEHIKENYARLKKEALDAWGEMIGVKPYLDYKGQGTGIISYVGEHGGWEGTRVTANEGWYSQFYKEHGRAPGERERYDIADREARAPMEASNDPEAAAELKNISAAKSRVEALEGLDTVIKGLDIPDLEARSLLSEKSYDLVYKPVLETLSNGPEKAAKAARESAIIMGRMADAFAVQYGVPVEKIAPEIMKGTNQKVTGKIYGEAFDVRRIGINKLSEFAERLKNGPKNPRLDTNGKIIHENAGDLKLTGDTGVIFPGERISHYEQHNLNGAHLDDIQQHVDSIEKAVLSKWQNGKYEGQYKGIYVIARVKGDLGKYYAVFCFTPNGKKYLTTVVKESDGGIYKKEIEDKTATVLSDYSSAETDGLASSSISTDIIQKKLAKRNNDTNEPYHQMAGEHAATAMVGRLQSAETMERNGTSPEEIWKETGWMRGPDHKWRFEIPGHLDQFNARK